MRLLQAQFTDFRNFVDATVTPGESLSALVGPNGQGKTNAIEAIYMVAALRPLRAVQRRALIRSGCQNAAIKAQVHHEQTGLVHDLEIVFRGKTRRLLRDAKEVSAIDFLGGLVAVSFTPDDLQLAKGSPEARRRFLDRALLNARPTYLRRALRYGKAMRDRNRLLQQQASDEELTAFDSILAEEGSYILRARGEYVHRLAPKLIERFQAIGQPAPNLAVRYASSLGEHTVEALMDRLTANRPVDRRRGSTSVGPHRDDLVFELDGALAKERASQGQHRALILALKLVELEDLTETLQEPPILLLDDMSSELDAARTRQLFHCVQSLQGQVILTSTHQPEHLPTILGHRRELVLQRVHAGTMSPAEQLFVPQPLESP
ncbi:MAG: DNA replication/repair protein RecF [Myxococcales bacterium]|nr:DNA replication/repair protein RecF [Myxococcales bacterium]